MAIVTNRLKRREYDILHVDTASNPAISITRMGARQK
jgi:hypothetical protein